MGEKVRDSNPCRSNLGAWGSVTRAMDLGPAILRIALLGVLGCATRPAPAPPPAQLPPGCAANLAGSYAHAARPDYQYQATDDGGTLVLRLAVVPPDGGAAMVDPSAPTIVLHREPPRFSGSTRARAFPSSSTEGCVVRFPTDVVSCAGGGLTLRTSMAAAVDPSCGAPDGGGYSEPQEQRLVRSASPDGGR